MGDAQAAAAFDRLPWLADEPKPPRRGSSELLGWALAALVLVAGASYWMGVNSLPQPQWANGLSPQATVALPQARGAMPSQPQVRPEPMPEVEPVAAPPMPVIEEPRTPMKTRVAPAPEARRAPVVEQPEQATNALTPWPARILEGAAGRLVRIGAFSSARQAKKGWWAIVRMNPALERLPAVVVPVRSLRDGRLYYRLQMGTTSQAHSEVLCQRMRMIGQSCIVIGLRDDGPEVGP